MINQSTEVAVVGGGMVGGALALGLAQQGFSVTVIEQHAPPAFDATAQPDVRISAISASSVALLQNWASGMRFWRCVVTHGSGWRPGSGKMRMSSSTRRN
jgi:2-polyprenyl-6-methoxyphenol hydroxylase-like FAD-dependent oxidoreductase